MSLDSVIAAKCRGSAFFVYCINNNVLTFVCVQCVPHSKDNRNSCKYVTSSLCRPPETRLVNAFTILFYRRKSDGTGPISDMKFVLAEAFHLRLEVRPNKLDPRGSNKTHPQFVYSWTCISPARIIILFIQYIDWSPFPLNFTE